MPFILIHKNITFIRDLRKSPLLFRHKLEKPLFVISVFLSFAIFFLSFLGYEATMETGDRNLILQIFEIESETAVIVFKIGGYIAIIFIIYIVLNVFMTYYNFLIDAKANDVYISEKQFPMLLEAEKEYAEKLGIEKLSQLFVSNEKEELSVKDIIVINPNVIRIPYGEIIVSANKDYYGPKFTIAKHLAYNYMGYCKPILFLLILFSNWIPILKNIGNRLMTYSTDKIAAELIGKENAIKAIMESAVDIWFIEYMNVEEYIENTKNVAKDKDMF